MRRHRPAVLLALLLAVVPALALTDEEIFREFRFNLINPGARSLALGGAFVSIAEDATAAQANPAGLAFLQRPEYFVELRAIDSAAQSFSASQTLPTGVETFVASGTDVEDVLTFSFLSVVTTYGKWTMGLSLQDVLNINNTTVSFAQIEFTDTPGALQNYGAGKVDVGVRNFNVSVGGRITERLSLGGTLTYSWLDAKSEVLNSFVDTNAIRSDEPVLEETPELRTTIDDSDYDVIYSLGLAYKKVGSWGFGLVYRNAPSFRVVQTVEPLLVDDGQPDDLFDLGDRFPSGQFVNTFHLPDSLGLGAHWVTARDHLTLTLDAERVRYSNLLDGFIPGVNVLTEADAEFNIDDATNVHLGAEYLFFNEGSTWPPLGLRGGAFTEPDTRISARLTGQDAFVSEEIFVGGDTIYHATVGVGLSFRKFQLDAGADFSELDNEFLISLIYRGK